MPFIAYFDRPALYRSKFDFYNVGSSPLLLTRFIEYLDNNAHEIEELFLSFYIFNNAILHDKLLALTQRGIKVNVVTIPIEGYDATTPRSIVDISSFAQQIVATKYDLARPIFAAHYGYPAEGFNFFLFPHMFIRSPYVIKFSRGNMPYSLHTKSFLIRFRNGTGTVGVSSSNFAVRDLVKEENLLLIENEEQYYRPALQFFTDLVAASIPIGSFDFSADYTSWQVPPRPPVHGRSEGFIAPFYRNSGFNAEDRLNELLAAARHEIMILGQHVCPIDYSFNGAFHSDYNNSEQHRAGLLHTIISRVQAGVKVTIGSQTFASDTPIPGAKFRQPANKAAFIRFFGLIREQPNIRYFVNENIHSKYIIIDGAIFISSFNYTPTQFIYLDQVHIPTLHNNPSLSYSGTYSETGQYVLINDSETVSQYTNNFISIMNESTSVVIQ